ncbi:hypothetical protein PEC18_34185 [Paucibacter sp. O1-1]|nr:hypothetical protein [Paucibacter sp. O1-1]MDA3830740.1 hypothetical protein [Paucibacter sp. O1-1]
MCFKPPKGWTCPKELDGQKLEGTFRSHQVPLEDVTQDDQQLALLEKWLRSYQPEQLFDEQGRLTSNLKGLIPDASKRMGSNLSANGGLKLKSSICPSRNITSWKYVCRANILGRPPCSLADTCVMFLN